MIPNGWNLALALIPRPLSAASCTHTSGVPYQEAPARCKARGNPTWHYVGSISQLRVSVKAPTEAAADVQRSKAVARHGREKQHFVPAHNRGR